jgi:hypothetical protein
MRLAEIRLAEAEERRLEEMRLAEERRLAEIRLAEAEERRLEGQMTNINKETEEEQERRLEEEEEQERRLEEAERFAVGQFYQANKEMNLPADFYFPRNRTNKRVIGTGTDKLVSITDDSGYAVINATFEQMKVNTKKKQRDEYIYTKILRECFYDMPHLIPRVRLMQPKYKSHLPKDRFIYRKQLCEKIDYTRKTDKEKEELFDLCIVLAEYFNSRGFVMNDLKPENMGYLMDNPSIIDTDLYSFYKIPESEKKYFLDMSYLIVSLYFFNYVGVSGTYIRKLLYTKGFFRKEIAINLYRKEISEDELKQKISDETNKLIEPRGISLPKENVLLPFLFLDCYGSLGSYDYRLTLYQIKEMFEGIDRPF